MDQVKPKFGKFICIWVSFLMICINLTTVSGVPIQENLSSVDLSKPNDGDDEILKTSSGSDLENTQEVRVRRANMGPQPSGLSNSLGDAPSNVEYLQDVHDIQNSLEPQGALSNSYDPPLNNDLSPQQSSLLLTSMRPPQSNLEGMEDNIEMLESTLGSSNGMSYGQNNNGLGRPGMPSDLRSRNPVPGGRNNAIPQQTNLLPNQRRNVIPYQRCGNPNPQQSAIQNFRSELRAKVNQVAANHPSRLNAKYIRGLPQQSNLSPQCSNLNTQQSAVQTFRRDLRAKLNQVAANNPSRLNEEYLRDDPNATQINGGCSCQN